MFHDQCTTYHNGYMSVFMVIVLGVGVAPIVLSGFTEERCGAMGSARDSLSTVVSSSPIKDFRCFLEQ